MTPTSKTAEAEPSAVARIVKRVPRPTFGHPQKGPPQPLDEYPPAQAQGLAGTYRVIHGRVAVPRADVTAGDWRQKADLAVPGDEIYLGNEDAARLLDADIIERLDVEISRVNQVWTAPPPSAIRRYP